MLMILYQEVEKYHILMIQLLKKLNHQAILLIENNQSIYLFLLFLEVKYGLKDSIWINMGGIEVEFQLLGEQGEENH